MKKGPAERVCLAAKSCTNLLFERRPRRNELAGVKPDMYNKILKEDHFRIYG